MESMDVKEGGIDVEDVPISSVEDKGEENPSTSASVIEAAEIYEQSFDDQGSMCSSFDYLTDSDSSDHSRDSDDFLRNPLADDVRQGYM